MPSLDRRSWLWLEEHHSLISRNQLLLLGTSPAQIKRLLSTGVLVAVHRGVYRLAGCPPSLEQRALAACLAAPEGVVSGTTAGALLRIRSIPPGPITITMPPGRKVALRGVRVVRSHDLDAVDVIHRADGIRHTSPPRTLFDLAPTLGPDAFRSAVLDVVNRGLCARSTLEATAARLAGRGRAGSTAFRAALAAQWSTEPAPQSRLEIRLADALERAGLPRAVRQYALKLADGRVIHLDLALVDGRLGLEVDHSMWHAERTASRRDKARDRAAACQGWLTLRVTEDDVEQELERVTSEIAAVYWQRVRRLTG